MLNRRNILILIVLVSVLLVAYWGFSSCLGPKPEPTPTLTPTVPPVTDDSWSRIQAAGKIVVGTSADYPPFEYYTGDFQVDGFDIALMREIGQRLGVAVEFQDFAFDGLGAALQIAQIDVVIAAVSVTPEREAFVDFSSVYYVGEDGVLAGQDATISIGSAAEMAGQRVGVQRGSAYEDWLRSSLVDTGLMPASNLFAYAKPEDAVRDLKEDRVDLVVMDALPAQRFADQGGVKLVGRGLDQQRLALTVRKGAASLKAEIDRALIELDNEGRVAQLAKQYLGLDPSDLLPTPTPTPAPGATVTPAPPPTCINGMAHVQDLTYDDKNMTAPPDLAPGQPFVKSWRVRNSGTCLWDETYRLVYVTGNVPAARMGGEPVAVTRQVATNDTYDLHVNLVAPLTPGIYQGFWQMVNGNNVPFGQRIYVGIRVPGAPTATPAPTQTPSPGIEFSADRTRIRAGERVVFTWKVENVKAVYFYSQGAPWEENGVAGHDSREVWPPRTTVYELRVLHRDNRVEIRQIRIEVEEVAGAPVINRFTVGPHQIEVDQCVDIRWEVQGSVDRVELLRNNVALWDGAPTSGMFQDCPPGAGEMSYLLEASGPGGTSRLQRVVSVVQPEPGPTATPIPTPTPGPESPVIDAFAVSPNQIQEGECVNVSWSASGGTTWVQIKRNGVVVLDGAPLESAVQDCLDESGRVTYRVEASNSAGETVFREETITVEEGPPPSPVLIIHSFTASADAITLGECVMLSWKYEGTHLSLVRLMRGEEVVLTDPPNEGNHQDCPPAAGQVIYQLILDAEDGTSAQKGYIVNVSLASQTWHLSSYYDGQAMTSVLEGTRVVAVFSPDGSLNGSAGCNTYNATYQVDGNLLTVGPAAVTGQSCTEPEGIMEQENAFLAALESAATYGVEGSQLIIKNASGQQVLTFEPVPEISPY